MIIILQSLLYRWRVDGVDDDGDFEDTNISDHDIIISVARK